MSVFTGTSGRDLLTGENGADVIRGLAGDDNLRGRGGNDRMFGGDGDDVIRGGAGDDYINPGGNTRFDSMFAGRGNDVYDFEAAPPASGFAFYEIDYRFLKGGIDARFNATSGVVKKGAAGTDTIRNMQTDESHWGMRIIGTHGDDRLQANVTRDTFFNFVPAAGNDLIIGGAGFDRISYFDWAPGIVVRVAAINDGGMRGKIIDQFGDTDTFRRIDEIQGSDADDRFIGSGGNDRFMTDGGDDFVNGRGGFDMVNYDWNGLISVTVNLARNRAVEHWDNGLTAGSGRFVDRLKNIEHIRGSDGNDAIRGAGKAEKLDGRDGNDRIWGNGGADTLIGGDGNDAMRGGARGDHLFGDDGDDKLWGNRGNDRITGGDGRDMFLFRAGDGDDTVADWQNGLDRIKILSGAAGFGDLAISQQGGDAVVAFANVSITLAGANAGDLDADDFLF